MKECRCNRDNTDRELEDKLNMFLHKYDIKRKVLSGKLNGVNYRRLMKHRIDTCDGIRDIQIG